MPAWLLPIIAIDLIITAGVVWWVFRGRSRLGRLGGPDLRMLADFANAMHPRVGEHMRVNWSGAPEQLPAVLRSLLDEVEREARSRSIRVDRATLKLMLARSLASQHIGQGSEVRQAFEEVA